MIKILTIRAKASIQKGSILEQKCEVKDIYIKLMLVQMHRIHIYKLTHRHAHTYVYIILAYMNIF